MVLDKLNSQESLERLAMYIVRAARQGDILDDEHTVTDATWSSKKISDILDELKTELADEYVAISQGTIHEGKYLQVNSDGNVEVKSMTFENDDIDFANDF